MECLVTASEYVAIVLYFRRGPAVLETVESILAQSQPPQAVLIFDNGSHDGVPLASLFADPRVSVTTSERNLGYAGGMNEAIRRVSESSDARVLLVTHEVLLERQCVETMMKAMQSANAAVVGPALKLPSGEAWSMGGSVGWRGEVRHMTAGPPGVHSPVSWLDGAVLLLAPGLHQEIGGFDERLHLYWEDVDYCLRAAKRGPVVLAEDAAAQQDTSLTPVYFGARNRLMVWRSHRHWWRVASSAAELAGRAARDAVRRDWPQMRARLRGIVDGLSGRALRPDMTREAQP